MIGFPLAVLILTARHRACLAQAASAGHVRRMRVQGKTPQKSARHPAAVQVPRKPGETSLPKRRALSRERLAQVLWTPTGERRLVSDRVLAATMTACEPDDVWWVCEMNSRSPLYFLPTREWFTALVRLCSHLGVSSVLEVGAGDGFVATHLQAAMARRDPASRVWASDTGAWRKSHARMTAKEKREYAKVPVAGLTLGPQVERCSAAAAIKRHAPEMVVVCWAPPGKLVEQVIRHDVAYVLDVSVDGDVCGNGARTWRFEKDFVGGELGHQALESKAFCRLDGRGRERQTRVTLYYGKAHPAYHEDKRYVPPEPVYVGT